MKPPQPFDLDDIESLPLVQMVSAGAPIHEGQVHRAWRAMVQTPGSIEVATPVVLKYMPSHVKLSIELACSLTSSVLHLPVPRGMVALANPAELQGLPTDARPLPGRAEVACYASVLRWPDDTAERAMGDDPSVTDFLWQRFCETKVAAPGAAWDELVANGDRHAGNFVYDGVRYWLIDHELSLKPIADAIKQMADQATRQQVIDHRARDNQVAQQMLRRRPRDHGILQQPRLFETRKRSLEVLAAKMRQWRTGTPSLDAIFTDAEIVLRGIIMRLPALALHLTDRLEHPTGPLLWTPSKSS